MVCLKKLPRLDLTLCRWTGHGVGQIGLFDRPIWFGSFLSGIANSSGQRQQIGRYRNWIGWHEGGDGSVRPGEAGWSAQSAPRVHVAAGLNRRPRTGQQVGPGAPMLCAWTIFDRPRSELALQV